MTHIYSYNAYSESAKELALALGIKRIKHENSKFCGNENKIVINWGSSNPPDEVGKCLVINDPVKVGDVSNKLNFFKWFSARGVEDYLVPWTDDKEQVKEWLAEKNVVVARHKLTGHSGDGIELFELDMEIPDAPLYTLYKKKKNEYRIHVVKTDDGPKVFDVQRKARDPNNDNPDWKVRNHANGFIFVRGDANPPSCVIDGALKVFEASGLDFGAIDTIYNEHENKAYVLEINTAPGLTGTTLDNYVKMFKENFL